MNRRVIAALALVAAAAPVATRSRWAPALALGLAGLIGMGAATGRAAPPQTAASAFELTLEGKDTMQWEDEGILEDKRAGTFRSRAPFCATGTFIDDDYPNVLDAERWQFICDDGTGSLTVSIAPMWWTAHPWNTATWDWDILEGSGDYAGLRGRGSLEGEVIGREISDSRSVVTWRNTFRGSVDRDAVAPTISFSSATATKLLRPTGAYALRIRLALRDDVTDNPVTYTLRTSAGGVELTRRFGTAKTEAVSMTLLIRPPARARTVRLQLTGEDPVGNAVSVTRALRLPR